MTTAQRRREWEASPPLGTRSMRPLQTWGLRLMCSLTLAVALGGEGRGGPYPFPLVAPPGKETQEPLMPIPPLVVEDGLQTQLGERLFHDPQLSHDNRRSCATCHPLDRGGMDRQLHALAGNGLTRLRNTPTFFNVGLT